MQNSTFVARRRARIYSYTTRFIAFPAKAERVSRQYVVVLKPCDELTGVSANHFPDVQSCYQDDSGLPCGIS